MSRTGIYPKKKNRKDENLLKLKHEAESVLCTAPFGLLRLFSAESRGRDYDVLIVSPKALIYMHGSKAYHLL